MNQSEKRPCGGPRSPSSKQETIRRIVEAARQEFAAKGLADARIDAIADAAGVTKQLIYHYFRSKEELFACVLDEASERKLSELAALNVDHLPPAEALRTFLNRMFDQYREDPAMASLAREGMRYHDAHPTPRNPLPERAQILIAKLNAILLRGAERGDFQQGIEPQLFFAAASLITSGGFTSNYLVSTLSGVDARTTAGMEIWREYSANLLVAAVSRSAPPSLGFPAVLAGIASEPSGQYKTPRP